MKLREEWRQRGKREQCLREVSTLKCKTQEPPIEPFCSQIWYETAFTVATMTI